MDVNLESVLDGLVNVSTGFVHSDELVVSWNKRNFSKTMETLAGVFSDWVNANEFHFHCQGDGSASTFWDFKIWNELFPNESEVPRETHANLIHNIQPDAKIVVIFRNPTDRLYSDYYYINRGQNISPMMFHRCSIEAITIFNNCLQNHKLRTCAYSKKKNVSMRKKDVGLSLNDDEKTLSKCPNVRLNVGLYDVFTQDWLNVFPRDQLFFMTTEDWNSNCVEYLKRIYMFLGLDIQSDDDRRKVCQNEHANTGKKKPPMLDESRELLDEFYRPHMRILSNLLNHTKYSWNL
ncbi:carbohydrate sulfotransferase 15-like [Anneissia japonica]|uniref:carbohydrate sulfotransferase 15-like n=1 Tax=Anneissia japonica TaxID=1529436 RepID=UPI00142557C5|nr:carbohydrate sulfotransferase 15-like [Anneissia japonica]